MQVQGSLRRVGEFVVAIKASHGKQLQNVQAITCHSDHDRITGAAAKFGDYISQSHRLMLPEVEILGI